MRAGWPVPIRPRSTAGSSLCQWPGGSLPAAGPGRSATAAAFRADPRLNRRVSNQSNRSSVAHTISFRVTSIICTIAAGHRHQGRACLADLRSRTAIVKCGPDPVRWIALNRQGVPSLIEWCHAHPVPSAPVAVHSRLGSERVWVGAPAVRQGQRTLLLVETSRRSRPRGRAAIPGVARHWPSACPRPFLASAQSQEEMTGLPAGVAASVIASTRKVSMSSVMAYAASCNTSWV